MVLCVGRQPGRMGPARPQTPRQRFSPLHPDSANGCTPANGGFRLSVRGGRGSGKSPDGGAEKNDSAKGPADVKRRFPPVHAGSRGTPGIRVNKNGGAKKITGYGFRGRRIRAARRRGSGPPAPKDPRLQCRSKRRTARRLRASGRTESNPHNNPLP